MSPKRLTEIGVGNRTPRNRIRPVSDDRGVRVWIRMRYVSKPVLIHIRFPLRYRECRERPLKRTPNTALHLTHVRERKLAVHSFDSSKTPTMRPDYTNISETVLLCNRCVCSWEISFRLGNVPSTTTTTESLIWWIIRCYIESLFSTSQYRSATTPGKFRCYIRCRFELSLLLLLLLLPFRWC